MRLPDLTTRTVRAALVAALAFVALVLPTQDLSAYTLNGKNATWPMLDLPVAVVTIIVDDRGNPTIVDADGGLSATIAAINSSTEGWNSTPMGPMVKAVAGDAVTSFAYGDGIPMVRFDDPASKCTGNCLAITNTWYRSYDGRVTWEIFDTDVTFNEAYTWISEDDPRDIFCEVFDAFYLENVIVHEIGHVLGLKHSDTPGATMWPSTSACKKNIITIESDDSRGLRDLYSGNPSCQGFLTFCSTDANCCRGICSSGLCVPG